MAGCVDSKGVPVRKMTEWVTNSEDLIYYLAKFVCNCIHEHSHPTGKEPEKLKLYPWKMCGAVVSGIQRLKDNMSKQTMYPNVSTDMKDDLGDGVPRIDRPPRIGGGCIACEYCLRSDSPRHTREPMKCIQSRVAPVVTGCPACDNYEFDRNPKNTDQGHSRKAGECRFASRPEPSSSSSSRTGAYPREPAPAAHSHESADTGAYDAAFDMPDDPGDRIPDPPRGPDKTPRTRRTYADAGTGDARLPTWNEFNVQCNLKNLRSYDPSVVIKELRKLHAGGM